MAFSLKKTKGPISDINVTPLVDVMLVLLVIFMITAPLMLNAIKLNLPKTAEVNRINLTTRQVVLSVTRSDEYYVGTDKILFNELISVINNQFTQNNSRTLFLRADFGMQYGKVAKLMSFLKKSGIVNIALVTETEKDK